MSEVFCVIIVGYTLKIVCLSVALAQTILGVFKTYLS